MGSIIHDFVQKPKSNTVNIKFLFKLVAVFVNNKFLNVFNAYIIIITRNYNI